MPGHGKTQSSKLPQTQSFVIIVIVRSFRFLCNRITFQLPEFQITIQYCALGSPEDLFAIADPKSFAVCFLVSFFNFLFFCFFFFSCSSQCCSILFCSVLFFDVFSLLCSVFSLFFSSVFFSFFSIFLCPSIFLCFLAFLFSWFLSFFPVLSCPFLSFPFLSSPFLSFPFPFCSFPFRFFSVLILFFLFCPCPCPSPFPLPLSRSFSFSSRLSFFCCFCLSFFLSFPPCVSWLLSGGFDSHPFQEWIYSLNVS